jgi:colanic acid biosynthesis glycosyl transferase WcaI
VKRRLWIVSELFYPETTSTGYILTRIAEALREDFHVHALCARPGYSGRGTRVPTKEEHNGVSIHRCFSTTLDKDVFLLRLLNLATTSVSIFLCSLAFFRPGDIILVVTNPPSLPYLMRLSSGLKRARCALLVHDVYPELLIAAGKLDARNGVAKILNWASRMLYRSMDRILVLGRDMKDLIEAKLIQRSEQVVIATNWADADIITPRGKEGNSLISELHLEGKFIVLYAGNMGYPQDMDSIVEAADLLSGMEQVQFLLIGTGAKRKHVQRAIGQRGLKNVLLLPGLPRDDQSDFLNACDVGLISLVRGMKGISVPSRFYNLLASGKPVIAIVDPDSEVGLAVEEGRLGWVVSQNDSRRLADTIRRALNDPQERVEMGGRAKQLAQGLYSFDRVISVYRETLRDIA